MSKDVEQTCAHVLIEVNLNFPKLSKVRLLSDAVTRSS